MARTRKPFAFFFAYSCIFDIHRIFDRLLLTSRSHALHLCFEFHQEKKKAYTFILKYEWQNNLSLDKEQLNIWCVEFDCFYNLTSREVGTDSRTT